MPEAMRKASSSSRWRKEVERVQARVQRLYDEGERLAERVDVFLNGPKLPELEKMLALRKEVKTLVNQIRAVRAQLWLYKWVDGTVPFCVGNVVMFILMWIAFVM